MGKRRFYGGGFRVCIALRAGAILSRVGMSTKITLESRQRLPSKVQDVICDSALIIQHATSASGSSEMLTSSAKQFCAAEQLVGTTAASLNKMDALLDAMQQQCEDVENKYWRDLESGAFDWQFRNLVPSAPKDSIGFSWINLSETDFGPKVKDVRRCPLFRWYFLDCSERK
ncbi:hypothetical protein Y032_0023g851 [Ancylostoma ceylanicum]|uniref:BLOC-1-related complex subunit 7 n=2 Tax=Ancylostoma ceylanicum TaxID=53326 RepID=A0A016UYK6_9BILA|nr:hypothetical protein Y032_0023g851 [Ancylostoma ceylanicum]